MRFDTLHRRVTLALAGLGLFALSLGDELSPVASTLTVIGYGLSFFAGPSLWTRPRYTSLWNGLIVGLLALQMARVFGGTSPIAIGIEFTAALQIAKLFHRVGARDYQHIQALALLHLIAATVLTTGFEYALVFIGFVIVLPWMLALTHLRGEVQSHYVEAPTKHPTHGLPSPKAAEVLRSRRIVGLRFLGWTATLSLPLFLVTAAFFLLFPRVGLGFLSFGEGQGRQVAGFGGDVQLGGFGVIRDDATVVVRLRPGAGFDPTEDRNNHHFRLRGTSFDRYEDARWSRSPGPPQRVQEIDGYYELAPTPPVPRLREIEIIVDPLDERVFFLPPGVVGIQIPPRVESGRPVYRQLQLSRGFDLRYLESDGLEVQYTALLDAQGESVPETLEEEDASRYLQLPEGLERIRALAQRIGGSGAPRQQAERIRRWLRDSGEFEYSLEMPDTRGRDPLEVFLFDAQRGHCEYFSSALAVMLRSLGVPTRNVTGFVGGVYNPYGEYYALRQGDAHSWVEAYIDGQWQTLDPTPAAFASASPPATGFWATLSAMADALRMRWSRDVVGYDLRAQVEGLRDLLSWFRGMRSDDGDTDPSSPERSVSAPTEAKWGGWVWLLLTLPLAFAVFLWRRRRKKAEMTQPLRRSAEDVRGLYQRLLRRLDKRGLARTPAATAREVLATAEAHFDPNEPDQAKELTLARDVIALYESVRFGGRAPQPEQVRALRRRL